MPHKTDGSERKARAKNNTKETSGDVIHRESTDQVIAEAGRYETFIYDCMIGDASLFERADNVEAVRRAVQSILDVWADGCLSAPLKLSRRACLSLFETRVRG
jgi:glucose-6-phosphate 1-dehydrogenase